MRDPRRRFAARFFGYVALACGAGAALCLLGGDLTAAPSLTVAAWLCLGLSITITLWRFP